MANPIFKFIQNEIDNNDIVVFIKGTANFPQCGYSGLVVNILKSFGVNFKDIDVLQDKELREGIKEFTNWPTVPQVYIKGEFIGGSDILKEMHQNGDLKILLQENNIIKAL